MNISTFLENEYKIRNWDPTSERSREQINAIERLVGGENLLLIQSTGWGKTVVYALATKYLRQSGLGPTIIVSPTLNLIRNQMRTLNGYGLRCETINHENKERHQNIYNAVNQNKLDVVLVSPEKATDEFFINKTGSPSLLVCDEAHCISEMGHDFRPDYKALYKYIATTSDSTRILATTATADTFVENDVINQLGNLSIIRGNLDKPNLAIDVIKFSKDDDSFSLFTNKKIHWLRKNIPDIFNQHKRVIIFCTKKSTVNNVFCRLNDFNNREDWNLRIGKFYSDGRLPRNKIIDAVEAGGIDVMVCTGPSLGVGIDAEFGCTIHYDPPMSIAQLYQEVGRAGRCAKSTPNAQSYIFYSPKNAANSTKTIKSNCVDGDIATSIYDLLKTTDASLDEIINACSFKENNPKLQRTLNILTSCNCIEFKNGVYRLSTCSLEDALKTDEKITNHKIDAFNHLLSSILSNDACIMQQMRVALGDPSPNIQPCGKCSVCRQNSLRC